MNNYLNNKNIRRGLIKGVTDVTFSKYTNKNKVKSCIESLHYDYDDKYGKEAVNILEEAIISAYNNKKVDLSKYKTETLYKAYEIIESDDGCNTYDLGVFLGNCKIIRETFKSSNLSVLVLNGDIFNILREDFPKIKLQDKDDYMHYIREGYMNYAFTNFAILGNYTLALRCTCILAFGSTMNNCIKAYKVNDMFSLSVYNRKTDKYLSVKSYNDIKRILSRVK